MKTKLPILWLAIGGVLFMGALSRGLDLGQQPLQPDEARLALASAQRIQPNWPWPDAGPQMAVAYAVPTEAIFGVTGLSQAAARAAPALAGVLLLLLPIGLAARIGWPRALLTSIVMLVSTSLWMVARTAALDSLAVLAVALLLFGALSSPTRPLLAGIGAGLGLASGAAFWHGLAGLLLAWPLARWLTRGSSARMPDAADTVRPLRGRPFALTAAVTSLALGSRFGTNLGDLGGLLAGPGEWLSGFGTTGLPFLTKLVMVPAYEPLLLAGGLAGAVIALRAGAFAGRAATAWLLAAAALYLLYPLPSGSGLAWVALPLAFLTASAIERLAERMFESDHVRAAWLLAGALITLVIFAGFSLEASIQGFGLASLDRSLQLVYGAAAIGFVVAMVVLFGLAWSWREAGLGFGLALLASLLAANVSAGWRLTHNPEETAGRELWRRRTVTANAPVLEASIASIANAHVGRDGGLPVRLAGGANPPHVVWLLRHQAQAGSQPDDPAPPIILAPESLDIALPADYLGQSVALVQSWGWVGAAPPDLLGWWLDRRGATLTERWILYVRDDIAGIAEPLPEQAE